MSAWNESERMMLREVVRRQAKLIGRSATMHSHRKLAVAYIGRRKFDWTYDRIARKFGCTRESGRHWYHRCEYLVRRSAPNVLWKTRTPEEQWFQSSLELDRSRKRIKDLEAMLVKITSEKIYWECKCSHLMSRRVEIVTTELKHGHE